MYNIISKFKKISICNLLLSYLRFGITSTMLNVSIAFCMIFQFQSTMNAQNRLTLEDLIKGGYNYDNMKVKDLDLKWDGEKIVEAKTPQEEDTIAVIKDFNLFVNGKQLTSDGSREIVYGESVHRNEFGIDGGLFWSPDKSRIAFYRMDQSMVTDYPQVDINGNATTHSAIYMPDKYPMAGETSHEVTIGVYDLKTEKLVYLNVGNPKDRYFTNVCWSPDNTKIYLFEVNRDQTDTSLDCYDALTGEKLSTLYTEHSDKYVEPLHPITFLPWDANSFLLQSQKDGYNSFYLFSLTPTGVKQIKSFANNNLVITDFYGFNPSKHLAIVQAVAADDLNYNLYSINIDNGKWKMLSNGKGYHKAVLNSSGKQLIDRWSAPDTPRQIDIVNTATGKLTPYFTAPNPWEGYAAPQFKSGTIKAADGETDLFYRLILPSDFDATKQYPAIVYVYGGPHARNVVGSWNYGWRPWEAYMPEKGYIVFVLDNRGSSDRGLAFEQVTFRQLGQEEMKDQMKGVEYLYSLPYVDKNRLGILGWSFGGFMTLSMLLNYPQVFKVGVAGGPVVDWKLYEVMYGERYMDTPQANPEGYAKADLISKVGNLNSKLMIIHGGNDATVVPQQSMLFLKAAIDANKPIDFFIYPEEEHNMVKHRRVHLYDKITQYFLDYLK